jgi:hypothetical protein
VTDERHERVARLLSEHGPLAPPALRQRIETQATQHANRRRRGRQLARFSLVAAAALVLLALVLPLGFDNGRGPTVLDAHALISRGPQAPAPAPLAGRPQLLGAQLDGLRFPNWKRQFGWTAYGRRDDTLDGRSARTVFYEHTAHRIAYTIVEGKPLPAPSDATHRTVDGVALTEYRDAHGHDIVAFQRQGKTCVLSGHVLHHSTLVKLATWRGDGRVTF